MLSITGFFSRKETEQLSHDVILLDFLQVTITILWLAKAAHNRGYQGPALDYSCFDHLIPVTKSSRLFILPFHLNHKP